MRFRFIVLSALAALLMLAPAAIAADACCDCCKDMACCKEMADCCKDQGTMMARSVLMPQMEQRTEVGRQVAVVWFMRPVRVGDYVLQGQYIIEHDNERMANGLPCTHIYAANKPQVPVVKFHCTHLERAHAERDTVVLEPTGDPSVPSKLQAFQFAGETAAHGVPSVR